MVVKRYFVCKECGITLPATSTRHKTGVGHVKHMYCFKCQKTVETRQVE